MYYETGSSVKANKQKSPNKQSRVERICESVQDVCDIANNSTASNTEISKILMKIKGILGDSYFESGVYTPGV